MTYFDPEAVDLATVALHLRATVGTAVIGEVVGRTRLRDVVAHHLNCSQLDAERIVDTMIGRGFVVREHTPDGQDSWLIRTPT